MGDRLALDPIAASGDPMQRLIARVADLEGQLKSPNPQRSYSYVPGVITASTASLAAYSMADGPSVSLLVPDNALVMLFAWADLYVSAGSGAAWLTIIRDGANAMTAMQETLTGGFQRRLTAPNSNAGVAPGNLNLSVAPAGAWIFPEGAGLHTYAFGYSTTNNTVTGSYQKRGLAVQVL